MHNNCAPRVPKIVAKCSWNSSLKPLKNICILILVLAYIH